MDTYFKHLKIRDWTTLTKEEKLELITQIRFKRRLIMAPVTKPIKERKVIKPRKKKDEPKCLDFDSYVLEQLLSRKILLRPKAE